MTDERQHSRRGLWRDIDEALHARIELARLEARGALLAWRRLTVSVIAAAAIAVMAGTLLLVALGESLDGACGLSRWGWQLTLGGMLLVASITVAWLARRRFQREFVGFEETLEELREDRAWLREWLGNDSSPPSRQDTK